MSLQPEQGPRRTLAAAALLLAAGCGAPSEEETAFPVPTGFPDIVESLREDLELERHPSDGGGRAWIEEARPERVRAGGLGSWRIVYETGGLGIADGGRIFLQVPLFWGWSPPQPSDPTRPGYVRVTTDSEDVELVPATVDQQLLAIEIDGRALESGERVTIHYGAGEVGAVADRYAETASRFWIAVDGDGDGVRRLISDSPTIDVAAAAAARLVLLVPSVAATGEAIEARLTALDGAGSDRVEVSTECRIVVPEGAVAPESVRLETLGEGRATFPVTAADVGVLRVLVRCDNGLEAESNPVVVGDSPRILWGDLHGHSQFSDGTGTPADYFRYARDTGALDVIALTDHDHWGLRPLATHPGMWEEIRRQVAAHHRPGEFVTLLGYEWTNWLHGHRHVLYFGDDGPILSAVDPDYETPDQLWAGLRGLDALTFAHHSAGGPVAVDWNFAPDPVLEPVTEIVSVHGSSEASDSPGRIYSPVAGNTVRDVLDHGHRLGFIGSGDGHDGHPGLAHLASPSGGLAAILSEDLTRAGVLEALRSRRVYATNGPRIVLRTSLAGQRMGSTMPGYGGTSVLRCLIAAEGTLDRVDVIQDGIIVHTHLAEGLRSLSFGVAVEPRPGGYLYVRAVQENGGAAWSSPFFFDEPGQGGSTHR